MITLKLSILEEHALDIIRSLEKLGAVSVIVEEPRPSPVPLPIKKWGGLVKLPSQELLSYAENVRSEWDNRI